jgi:hypothetical protein
MATEKAIGLSLKAGTIADTHTEFTTDDFSPILLFI